ALPVAVTGGFSLLACLLIARRFEPLSLTDAATWRATFGSVAYLMLIAFLSLGIAALLRDSAASIGAVLGLLYLPPIISSMVADRHLHRLFERAGPMDAGLAVQATTHLDRLPIGPWAGFGVLAAWSAGALLAGTLRLTSRDV
ncbi:MAG TPA: ABC transporter permease, partial [Pseudonocardiaceae bacterium]